MMEQKLIQLAKNSKYEPAVMLAFLSVETGGKGFDEATGKIIIQFEPAWFKRKAPYAPSGLWSLNKIDRQKQEWIAFNDAYGKNRDAAMESTSIGLGQIMGFHYKRLGYFSVGEMWDDAKKGLDQQFKQLEKFISTDKVLQSAIRSKNWGMIATLYNGAGYKKLAQKYGREPYDVSMEKAYKVFKEIV